LIRYADRPPLFGRYEPPHRSEDGPQMRMYGTVGYGYGETLRPVKIMTWGARTAKRIATQRRCPFLELWNWGDGKDSWDGARYFWRDDYCTWHEVDERRFTMLVGLYAFGVLSTATPGVQMDQVLGELVRQTKGVA
jgi:hypothetical protein